MLYLSATLIAFLSFVAVVLVVCVMAYRNADRLEAFATRKFRKKAPCQNGGQKQIRGKPVFLPKMGSFRAVPLLSSMAA